MHGYYTPNCRGSIASPVVSYVCSPHSASGATWVIVGLLAAWRLAGSAPAAHAEDGVVRLHSAGSLKPALTEVAQGFTAAYGIKVDPIWGASGLLRERLERGEAGDVYASADMGNPLALAKAGKAGPVVMFTRNRLCALARPGLPVTTDTVLDVMLAPEVKLATSTPGNDPAGDYAAQVFTRAEAMRPGAARMLGTKALRLVGGASDAQPPAGRNAYGWHLMEGRADIFLAYCTAGLEAAAQSPGIPVVELPAGLSVGAEYGLTALRTADPGVALPFISYVLSAQGQTVLARYGFDAPLAPH